MLISVLVFSFQSAANLATSYDTSIAEGSLQSFNSNFEKNAVGEVEIQHIITMAHFAKDYNTRNEYKKGERLYITVILERTELTDKTDEELINIMTENTFAKNDDGTEDRTEFQKYKCEVEYNDEGRIQKVTCKKV